MEEKKKTESMQAAAQPCVSTPHDKGYKKNLSRPAEFLHFLKKYVKADWMMELQESDLSLCDKGSLAFRSGKNSETG